MIDKSGNPALSDKALGKINYIEGSATATVAGTTFKIFVLLFLTIAAGYFGWQAMQNSATVPLVLILGAVIIGTITAIATVFNPTIAPVTGPIYAISQGYVMGAISQVYNAQFDGIVVQAIGLTGAIFFVSLWAFSAGLIKVTEKFRTGVIIATLGIAVYYLIALVLSLFGVAAPLIFDTGTFGIIFSLVVIFIATLNLILDFDLIKKLEERKAPKAFEWYGAFALMVTLIWLYLEVLRLLGKTRS
jgi:uncharacterized YccA/Bax inhibitor family protein